MASAGKALLQSFKRFFKMPWEITGPCTSPEYRSSVPMATEYRRFCPATAPAKVRVPTSEPETVFDIKYYTRDRRRDRPPVRRTLLRKPDVERIMAAKAFGPDDFPKVYLTEQVEEDENARGGGYQKWQQVAELSSFIATNRFFCCWVNFKKCHLTTDSVVFIGLYSVILPEFYFA
ncbi:hypothetical protein BHM03_00022143 [Ensete ventricosum]|nr:hypothetical protein BHM03_00022143 [Ensete ventricosum]